MHILERGVKVLLDRSEHTNTTRILRQDFSPNNLKVRAFPEVIGRSLRSLGNIEWGRQTKTLLMWLFMLSLHLILFLHKWKEKRQSLKT